MSANIVHHEVNVNQTASGGAWSFNTSKLKSGLLRLIVIKPLTSDTTYRLTITDSKNNIIYYNETAVTGTLREQLLIPVKDVNTIAVSGASRDELFSGLLSVEE